MKINGYHIWCARNIIIVQLIKLPDEDSRQVDDSGDEMPADVSCQSACTCCTHVYMYAMYPYIRT